MARSSPECHGTANNLVSTLVLLDDDEYELQASRGVIAFPQWGSAHARDRVARFRLALVPRGDVIILPSADSVAVPVVITPPFTPRFHLRTESSKSLTTLVRATSTPLEFNIEFQPPADDDPDSVFENFHDHITVQTRLAKVVVRLLAMRKSSDVASCRQDSFMPRNLPAVKAPPFKLFDQIEREETLTFSVNSSLSSSAPRLNASCSFHPQKNSERRLESLAAPMPRQPTPPRQAEPMSRPSSTSSHGRRTPSPRILDPLVESLPASRITADVSNQMEAREVILRLRARRSALNYQKPVPDELHDETPSCPESRLKSKAELDDFNELVMVAKKSIAGEMDKAKNELDFYKSILPRPQNAGVNPLAESLKTPVVQEQFEKHAPRSGVVTKKPAKLPTLSPPQVSFTHDTSTVNNNQELSPTKGCRGNPTAVETTPVDTTSESAIKTAEERRSALHQRKPRVTTAAPMPKQQATAKEATVPLAVSKGSKSTLQKSAVKKSTDTQAAKSTAPRLKLAAKKLPMQPMAPAPAALAAVDALQDFDESDPEIDDAPIIPDDLGCKRRQEEDDEEDIMMTMKVSC